jgi:glycosyltransferase involved in cell wall biosynthesis
MDGQNQDDTEKPLVSVVVPVYNTERFLQQCVNSLLHQTLKNIEIILVDDGSPDKCPAMCDAYAEQDKRVKVLHQQNGGYGKACNAGLGIARGEYLGIVESDDYVEPDMMERLYNAARAHDLDVSRCHFYLYNSGANTHDRIDFSYVPQNMVYSPRDVHGVFYQQPSVWAMIYRADFIKENGINFLETPGASYQDASFSFKVYACADRFMLTGDTLVHYRIDNEDSSVNSNAKIFCVCEEYAEIERFAREKDLYDRLKNLISKLKYSCYMWNYRRLDKKSGLLFLKVFAQEMRRHIGEKTITKDFFSQREIARIYVLAFFYPLYHFKQFFR